MHVGSALEAIKKKGYFKAHKDANKAYVEQRDLVKQAKATLASSMEQLAMGQDLTGSLPRSPRKLLLQPVNLTQPCKLNTTLKSSRPKKPQRKPRPRQNKLP
jgi:hypothetical protein